jgi:hypothetical protein
VSGGYVGASRIEDGLTNLCGLVPQSTLKTHRGDLDRLAASLFPTNPALGGLWRAMIPVSDWKTVADVRVVSSIPRIPGILYAGDSKGTIDPLGGQGMTLALLGAELLVPYVKRALTQGGVTLALQRSACTEWHRRFDRRIALCHGFHHALVNPWIIDAASCFSSLASHLLALGYRLTRDELRATASPPIR